MASGSGGKKWKGGKSNSKGQTMSGYGSQTEPYSSFNMDSLSEELTLSESTGADVSQIASCSSSYRNSPSRIPLYVAHGPQPHHSPLRAKKQNVRPCGTQYGTPSRIVPDAIHRQQIQHNLTSHQKSGRRGEHGKKSERRGSSDTKSAEATPSRTRNGQPTGSSSQIERRDSFSGAKYEDYMPLCQLQKALKKGEILEVSISCM